MKNRIATLLFLSALSLASCKNDKAVETTEAGEVKTAANEATVYTIDKANSTIEWTGSKPTGKHTGRINVEEGTLYLQNDALDSGKITIDMNSLAVTDLKAGDGKEDLEAHLKGTGKDEAADEFFNVKKYPQSTFEITNVVNENEKTTIEGNLTMKGVTKNVKFPATVTTEGNSVTIVSETFAINRTQWNINYGSKSVFDNLGDKFINDDIELKVSIKATK